MVEAHRTELVIVGAGPVGLYAAYYAGFRGLECIVVDALPFVGGQISTFYADSTVYDVPGFPEIRAGALLDRLEAQARRFDAEIRLGARVTGLNRTAGGLRVLWSREESGEAGPPLETKAVLLATGIGRFAPQPIPDADIHAWAGRGLDYSVTDPAAFTGRRVVVAGGTPRGVELALALVEAGAETTLIHRRERIAISATLRERFDASAVRFLAHRELAALHGDSTVERVTLTDRRDGSTETVEADHVFPCFGFSAHRDLVAGLDAKLEEGAIEVDSSMAAAPGIWAAGDAATYPGKVRLLAADFGEACTAVNNATTAILPGAPLFPGYSSHRDGAARRPG